MRQSSNRKNKTESMSVACLSLVLLALATGASALRPAMPLVKRFDAPLLGNALPPPYCDSEANCAANQTCCVLNDGSHV